jgi:tryptophanyl-tRNA synthetase
VTDSTPVEEPKPMEDSALYQLLKVFAPDQGEAEWVDDAFRKGGTGYGEMKKRLFEYYLSTFADARARFEAMQGDPAYVERILADGAVKARETAAPLMDEVRRAVGIR